MQAISFWILLEIHDLVINMILDEAVLCLHVPTVNVSDVPLTHEERLIPVVNKIVFESFSIAFEEIIQEVSGKSFAQLNIQPLAENQRNNGNHAYPAPAVDEQSVYNSVFLFEPLYALMSTNGVNVGMYPVFTPSASMFAGGSNPAVPRNLPNHTLLDKDEHLPEIKRALMFTFTREHPLQQKELESFLVRSFGDGSIQKVTMEHVSANEQPLWASVVFYSEIPVLTLMQVRETAPMSINGKKVWASSC
ncbi:hypothetical protein MKW94_001829 [Papaver nudicaule]|uniref:Uncharacterized protein n=1 Tax=Papaver nudicaule TaxID=74823 RepID=A0AA41VNH8_PAPNU|nr:hypothetical protein [Papaver nudicaule]